MEKVDKIILTMLQMLCKQDEKLAFEEMLENHDWFYFNSDDKKVYNKGWWEEQQIKRMIAENSDLEFMYWKKKDEIYSKNK